jgi:hypothetical protein
MDEATFDLTHLAPARLRWDQIYLDPNNPRLAGISDGVRVEDEHIADPDVQDTIAARLREVGYSDIAEKIKKLGFLPIDRIVVRPIRGQADRYVVLEGNRRIAALRSIRGNPVVSATLPENVRTSLDEIDVLVYDGDDADIAWLIQGVRHIESIKEWGPFQQARFLVDLQQRRGIPIKELAAVAGVSGVRVGRLVRSYHAWTQASQDSDFGGEIDERDFSIFLEAVFHRNDSPLRTWLEWDEQKSRFGNDERLRTLLALMKSTEEGAPRITRVNPDLRDRFSKLTQPGNEGALNAFLGGERTLDESLAEVEKVHHREELLDLGAQRSRLSELMQRVETLPLPKIIGSPESPAFIELLDDIAQIARQQAAFLRAGPVPEE